MSQTKKTYVLNKVKQLIDLNGDSINFELSFNVTCHDDKPFKVLVVDQTTLDNSEELNYKEIKNSISGNIIADKNVYQNYFLILKSENTCKVDVELTKKELPLKPVLTEPSPPNPPIIRKMISPPSQSFNWQKIGLIVIIVIVGTGLLWYFYKKNNESSIESVKNNPDLHGDTHEKFLNTPNLNFGMNLDPNTYHPKTTFNSHINNNQTINSSNRSVDMSDSYIQNKHTKGENNLSILDRLRNTKI